MPDVYADQYLDQYGETGNPVTIWTDKFTGIIGPNWTVTDTGANLSVASGRAFFDGGLGSPAWGDPGIRTGALTRSTLGAFVALIRLTNNSDDGPRISLSPSSTDGAATGAATITFDYPDLYGSWKANLSRTKSIDYLFALVPRPGGGFFRFISGGEFGTFPTATLVGVSDTETDATLYGHISNRNSVFYVDRADALTPAALPTSLTTRFGPALAADNFDGGVFLSGRVTPFGGKTWNQISGTISTSGDTALMTSASAAQLDAGASPRIIEATFARNDPGSRVLLYFRGNNTDTGSWRVKGENDRVGLHNASGLVTQTGAGGSFFGTGVQFKLRVVDWGNHIEVFVNGTSFLQADSTTGASNVRVGVGVENGAGVCYEVSAYPANHTLNTAFGGTGLQPVGLGSAVSSDVFTAADATSLATYGNGWTANSGTWQINTNRLRMTAAGNGFATKSTGETGVDHEVRADILLPNTTPNYSVGGEDWFPAVVARWTDASNYLQARFLYQSNSPEVEVWEMLGGVNTLIGYINLGTDALPPNTTHNLRLAVLGNQIAAYFDGSLVVQATTALLTGNRYGLGVSDSGLKSGQPAWDNVELRTTSSIRGDALTKKALTRLSTFTSFLDGVAGKTGFLGGAITEVGIPQAKADSSPPAAYVADVPLWQKLLDNWYTAADDANLTVTAWSSGFFGDYELAIHSNDSVYGTATNIDKFFSPGAIDIVEAHPVQDGATYRRGVNVAGMEFGHKTSGFDNAHPGTHGVDYFAPTAGDAVALATRKITTVRLPISWERLQPTLLGPLDSTYLGRITAFVNACASNGVGVILDLHNYARYEYSDAGTKKVLVLREPDGIDLASAGPTGEDAGKIGKNYLIDVWRRLSEVYRTNSGVIAYELMNEPHDVAPSSGSFSGSLLNNWNDGTVQSWAADFSGATVAHTLTTPYEGTGALRITKTTGAAGAFHLQRAERGSVAGTGNILRGQVRLNGAPTGTWQARFEWQNNAYAWQAGAVTTLVPGTWVEVSCDFSSAPIASDARNLCIQIHSNNPGAAESVSVDLDFFQRGSLATAYTDAQAWEQISQAVVNDLRTRTDDTTKRDTKTILVPGHGWNVLSWSHTAPWITEPAGLEGTHRYVTHQYFDAEAGGNGDSSGGYDPTTKRYSHSKTWAQTQGFVDDTDTTAPTISALSVSSITNTGAVVTWTTDQASDTRLEYGINGVGGTLAVYGSSTTRNTSPLTSHSVTLTGLLPGVSYRVRARSRDDAANPATAATTTFTTTGGGGTGLLWSDEFTTLSLATDAAPTTGTWRTRGYESGGTLSTGYQDYAGLSWNTSPVQHPSQNPFSVSGSVLTIKAQRTPGGVSNVSGAAWMGGYLVTNHLLSPTPLRWRYGYFECRARFPNPVRGMFPAIWMFNNIAGRSDGKESAELDILEIFGENDGQPWASGWHNKPTPGTSGNIGYFDDSTTGWHRYGMEWTPTAIRYYKDGILKGELTGAAAEWFQTADLGFRLDYVMDPSWEAPGSAFRSTTTDPPLGTEPRMEVDYVRAYGEKPTPFLTGSDDPTGGGPSAPPLNGDAYSTTTMSLSPWGYYRLNETAGTTMYDSSGNTRHGTYTGTVSLNETGLAQGTPDPAVLFGTDGYGAISGGSAGIANTSAFTVEALFVSRNNPVDHAGYFGSRNFGNGDCYVTHLGGTNKLEVRANLGGTQYTMEVNVTPNARTHLHMVYDGSTLKCYLNGVLGNLASGGTANASIAATGQVTNTGVEFGVGRVIDKYAATKMDEFVIYRTALSPTQVARQYQNALLPPRLIGSTASVVSASVRQVATSAVLYAPGRTRQVAAVATLATLRQRLIASSARLSRLSNTRTVSTSAHLTATDVVTITEVRIDQRGQRSAVVKWTTDIPATSWVEYSTEPGAPYEYSTEVDLVRKTNHTVVIKDLEPHTTYYYRPASEP